MPASATDYDKQFYAVGQAGAISSASVIVPLLLELISPKRVVDVGCGEGWFAKAFEDAGCEVVGLDGEYAEPVIENFIGCDLELGLPVEGGFDLAVSLEVAEHLPEYRADSFIAELCSLAPVIAFSAAIPGQGGTHHVNEQWPAYWVERFQAQGFKVTGDLRWRIWNDDRVENWYRQNLLLAVKADQMDSSDLWASFDEVLPVVHPVLFDARRQ